MGASWPVATDDAEIHLVRLDRDDDDPVVLTGHTSIVHALRYTPDGRRLVSGSGDHTLGIWDLARAELIARLWNHADYVFDIDVGPDGERVVTASGDGTARIWEPSPLVERLAALEDREARLERLRPLIRERVERDGLRATGEGLKGDSTEPGWDARDRELALQVLLELGPRGLSGRTQLSVCFPESSSRARPWPSSSRGVRERIASTCCGRARSPAGAGASRESGALSGMSVFDCTVCPRFASGEAKTTRVFRQPNGTLSPALS